jgi:hypothetical protein
MDPSIRSYWLQTQQAKQQEAQQEQPGGNMAHPFQSGVSLAMQAARQSLGSVDPEQQRRNALGRGIISFGQAMGQPSENRLAGINQALGSGINSYLQERNAQEQQEQQMNAMLYAEAVRQKELEMAQMRKEEEAELDRELKREELAQRMTMHEQELGESRRAHDLAHRDRSSLMQLRNSLGKQEQIPEEISEENEGLYGVQYTPFTSKKQKDEFDKEAAKEKKTLDVNKRLIHSTTEMDKIFDKYPDISSSFLNYLVVKGKDSPSYWQMILRNSPLIDKEKLNAIEKLKKLSADVKFDIISGLAGSKATDRMKQIVDEATASGMNQSETAKYVNDYMRKLGKENIKKIEIYEEAQKRKMMPLFTTMEEEGSNQELSPQLPEMSDDIGQLSDEELERIANQ